MRTCVLISLGEIEVLEIGTLNMRIIIGKLQKYIPDLIFDIRSKYNSRCEL